MRQRDAGRIYLSRLPVLFLAALLMAVGSVRLGHYCEAASPAAADEVTDKATKGPFDSSESQLALIKARSLFGRASGLEPDDEDRVERLLECEAACDDVLREHGETPEAVEALFYRSEVRRLLGEFELAIEGYEKLIDTTIEEDGLRGRMASSGHLGWGLSLLSLDQWSVALKQFQRVTTAHPSSAPAAQALFQSGICFRELNRYEEATQAWDLLESEHPHTAFAQDVSDLRETLKPPLQRLAALVPEYDAAIRTFGKTPKGGREALLERISKILGRIGDVHCPESAMFLTRVMDKAPGTVPNAAVVPLINCGGELAASYLLARIDTVKSGVQRHIFDGLQARHLAGISIAPVGRMATKSGRVGVSEAAIRLLGRIGSREAAGYLLDATVSGKNPDAIGRVGIRVNGLVARVLRKIRSSEVWASLAEQVLGAGDSAPRKRPTAKRSVTERRIVAEAMGYSRYSDAPFALTRALSDPSSRVAAAAVSSLGRLRAQEAVDGIVKQIDRRRIDPRFLRAAVEALTWLDPSPALNILVILAESRDLALRTLCVKALGKIEHKAAQDKVIEGLSDPAWQVRKSALRASRGHPSAELIDALVASLRKEDGALLPEIIKSLILLTGADLGPKYKDWKEYWDVLRPDYVAKNPEDEESSSESSTFVKKADPDSVNSPEYFGVEIVSKRIAFIVDCSGSMRETVVVPRDDGGSDESTRIELAKGELEGAIGKLRPGTFFNIVHFATNFSPMAKKLVKLSRKSFRKAKQYVRRLSADGGTNIYDSLEMVLKAGEVDTIFLLSDGAPSAGKYTDPDQILQEIRRLNATAQVTIHTISLGMDSSLMRRLAEDNDGKYIVVGEARG